MMTAVPRAPAPAGPTDDQGERVHHGREIGADVEDVRGNQPKQQERDHGRGRDGG